ncbi:MAG: methyltransferase domain-containing protein [Anaerolineaceae bacterium]
MSGLSVEEWHRRFEFQAGWTSEVRDLLYRTFEVGLASKILEVGCGTGAVLSSMKSQVPARYFGIDLDRKRVKFAYSAVPGASFAASDGLRLPFPSRIFRGALCHFLLLWTHEPLAIVQEMARTVSPGGFVAALAEPDYGSRIDYPEFLAELGRLQRQALQNQGADAEMGRKLAGLFSSAGLVNIQTGIVGAMRQLPDVSEDFESEWAVLESDLSGLLPAGRLAEYKTADFTARKSGERVLFVPTFYAVGRVL